MAIPFFIQHNRAGVVIDRLVAFAVPQDATYTKMTYKSSNIRAATVNSSTGVVTTTKTAGDLKARKESCGYCSHPKG